MILFIYFIYIFFLMGLKNGILVNFLLVGLIFIIKERTKDYVGKLMQYLEREEEKRKEIVLK